MLQWPGEQLNCGHQMAGMGGVMVGKWDKTGIKILLGGIAEEILHSIQDGIIMEIDVFRL